MSALLIYNDQLLPAFIKNSFKKLGSAVLLKITPGDIINDSFTIDKHISNFLLEDPDLVQDKYDVIFIPYSLSDQNYSEFLGLRLAFHIRLTDGFKNIQTPIVFYGVESPWEICKLSPLGEILFTKNIFITQEIGINSFTNQTAYIKNHFKNKKTDNEFLKEFISKVNIKPPSHYNSHHSINNDLALLLWSEAIGCDKDITEVKNNLQTGLYFKYTRVNVDIYGNVKIETAGEVEGDDGEESKKPKKFLIDFETKPPKSVFLIDDESEKGWGNFYKRICDDNKIDFNSLKLDYKSQISRKSIIEDAINVFKKEYYPEIVLIDLRLHDDDFRVDASPTNLTGFKILEEIKKINKGIQVIITTASNKSWNYEALMTGKFKADGYILKNGEDPLKDIINIKNIFIDAAKRAPKLIKACKLINELKAVKLNLINVEDKNFKNTFKDNLDISYKLLEESFFDGKYLNYSFLQLYHLIESFVDEIFDWSNNTLKNGFRCTSKNNTGVKFVSKNGKCFELSFKKEIDPKEGFRVNHYIWGGIQKSDEKIKTLTTLAKTSFYIAFYKSGENDCLKRWGHLNGLRNSYAGHKGTNIVEWDDIFKMLYFCKYIFDENSKSCFEPLNKNHIERLKTKFR